MLDKYNLLCYNLVRRWIMQTLYMAILFFVLQLINVIFSIIKSLLLFKGTKFQAAITNAVYYSLYTVIVIFMVSDFTENAVWNWIIKISIVFVTNFVGAFISFEITDLLRKDKIWEVTALFKKQDEINEAFSEFNSQSIDCYISHSSSNGLNVLKIYSANRKTSKIIDKIIKKYKTKTIVHEENGVLYSKNA